uniref:SRCR domain-containing protein n=1 Tax=Xiphophorus maculatus TaxID=8083 RepID=A0A3B5QDT9_XIPMA
MDQTALMLLLCLCSSALSDELRLVAGRSRCVGRLEKKNLGAWKPVNYWNWYMNLTSAAAACRQLHCGSVVSSRRDEDYNLEIICSDSVRLVQGTNRCSGRLEVKTDQSWSSVCEKDFDLQDAEVVCREIGCGPPSVHQGALYGEAEAPVGSREFLCEGSESALLNCSSRKSSGRNSCSPGQAVGLTCSGRGGSADLLLFTASLPSLMNSLSLLRSRQHQVGGRGQPMCRETGDVTSKRVETSGCLASLLGHELSCCSLCRTGLWFCCFSKKVI